MINYINSNFNAKEYIDNAIENLALSIIEGEVRILKSKEFDGANEAVPGLKLKDLKVALDITSTENNGTV